MLLRLRDCPTKPPIACTGLSKARLQVRAVEAVIPPAPVDHAVHIQLPERPAEGLHLRSAARA